MSGGGGGVIIIHHMIDSGYVTVEEKAQLLVIADRSGPVCSIPDAWYVCRVLWRILRCN